MAMSTPDNSAGFGDWTDALNGLPPAHRRAVMDAVSSGRLSGWRPLQQDVERLAALAVGTLSFEDYRSQVLTRKRRS